MWWPFSALSYAINIYGLKNFQWGEGILIIIIIITTASVNTNLLLVLLQLKY